jgi:hypothetical protein
MIGALVFGASVGELVEQPGRWGNNFDLGVGQGGDALPNDVISRLTHERGVAAVTLFATVTATADSAGFYVTGMRVIQGSSRTHLFDGHLARQSNEMVIGRVASRRLSVGVGDRLSVSGPAGRRTYRITGIGVLPSVEGADGVGEGGLVSFAGLHRLDPSAVPTAAGLRLRLGSSTEIAKRLSTDTGMAVGPGFDPPAAIVNVGRVRAMPYLVAGVLGALAVLNLAHQLILSSWRRRRDLAVLRAIGANNQDLTRIVHWQTSLFTLAVIAIAAPVGMVAGRLVYRAFVDRIGAVEAVTVPTNLLMLAFVALVALANVVAVPIAYRTRRRSPAAFLAEE